MKFIEWLAGLGDKAQRTDVWVFLYTLTMLTSATFFFGCGAGYLKACSTTFITANTVLLTTHVTGIMVDLGIRRWNEGKTNTDRLVEQIIKKLKDNE